MNHAIYIALLVATCFSVGCSEAPVAQANGAAIEAPTVQQQEKEQAKTEGGISETLGNFVDNVAAKTPSMDDIKKALNDTGNATNKTTEDMMAWANKQFTTLKEHGETQTGNVQEWLKEDWNNANAWEYQVVRLDVSTPETLQEKLNEAGKLQWDCFHVSDNGTGTTFYMKRRKKSYMKSLPFKDMLKLVPLVPLFDGGE